MFLHASKSFGWSGILTASLMAVVIGPPGTSAEVVFDNFDPGGGFHASNNIVGADCTRLLFDPFPIADRGAAKFTVTGGSLYLSSITLAIAVEKYNTSADLLRVRLTTDDGGVPGTTLEVLSENQAIWPAYALPFSTTTTLASIVHPQLIANADYWIVTELTSMLSGSEFDFSCRWFLNTTNQVPWVSQTTYDGTLPEDPWPPFSGAGQAVAFRVDGSSVTAVEGPRASGSGIELGMARPNPAPRTVSFDLRLGTPGTVSCEVFDPTGRRVTRILADRPLSAGEHRLSWDGRDGSGRRVSTGIYIVRVTSGGAMATRRLVITR